MGNGAPYRSAAWVGCVLFALGLAAHAQPLPVDLALPNTTVTSGTAVDAATNSITAASGFNISGSAAVTFTAGSRIALEPGFHATAGTAPITFHANIATSFVTTAPVTGLPLTVDNTPCTSPCGFQWQAGSSHTIATAATQSGATGTQYLFANWSDGGALSHGITVANATYTANFTTQYYLTTATFWNYLSGYSGAQGTISPGSNWRNSGDVVSVSAAANSGYQFQGFSGNLAGRAAPQNLTMTGPMNVTANFGVAALTSNAASGPGPTQFSVRLTSPNGVSAIGEAQLLLNWGEVGSSACYVEYLTQQNWLSLADDSGGYWLGLQAPGTYGTVSNSQCALDIGASSVTNDGTALTLNVSVSFQPAFAGTRNEYVYDYTSANAYGPAISDWEWLGTYVAYQGPVITFNPSSASLGSAGGQGSTSFQGTGGGNWTAVASDTWIHVTSSASGAGDGTLSYSADANPNGIIRSSPIRVNGFSFWIYQAPAPIFNLAGLPSPINLIAGNGLSFGIAPTGATNPVCISASITPAPQGVTVGVSPACVTAPALSFLTITSSTSAPTATYTITLTGVSQGYATAYATATLNVSSIKTPTLTATCAATPSIAQPGQSATFSATVSGGTAPYSYNWFGAISGATQTVQFQSASTGTFWAYLQVTDAQNHTASNSCSVAITQADFTLSVPLPVSVVSGSSSASYAVQVIGSRNFTGTVQPTYDVSGLPCTTVATANQSVTSSGTAVLTVPIGGCPAGTYNISVTGHSGTVSRSASTTLNIQDLAKPTLSISVPTSQASQTIAPGSSASYSLTVTSASLTGPVLFTASGLPSGATATFNPASLAGSGSTTLTVTTTSTVLAGSYSLTIAGAAPSSVGTVVVAAAPAPQFIVLLAQSQGDPGLSISTPIPAQTVNAGGTTSYLITVTPAQNPFSGTVDFRVAGIPVGSGMMAVFNPPSIVGSGATTLTIHTDQSTPAGTFPLYVIASTACQPNGCPGSQRLSYDAGLSLTVQPPSPGFSLSVSPASQIVAQGGTTEFAAIVTNQCVVNFNGTGVQCPDTTSPQYTVDSSISATFDPPPSTGVTASAMTGNLKPSNSKILTVTNAAAGTIIVHVTMGGITQSAAVQLVTATAIPVGNPQDSDQLNQQALQNCVDTGLNQTPQDVSPLICNLTTAIRISGPTAGHENDAAGITIKRSNTVIAGSGLSITRDFALTRQFATKSLNLLLPNETWVTNCRDLVSSLQTWQDSGSTPATYPGSLPSLIKITSANNVTLQGLSFNGSNPHLCPVEMNSEGVFTDVNIDSATGVKVFKSWFGYSSRTGLYFSGQGHWIADNQFGALPSGKLPASLTRQGNSLNASGYIPVPTRRRGARLIMYPLISTTSYFDVLFNDIENAGPAEFYGVMYGTFASNTMFHNVLGDIGGQNAVNDGPWPNVNPNYYVANSDQDVVNLVSLADPSNGSIGPYQNPFTNLSLTGQYAQVPDPQSPTSYLPSKVAGMVMRAGSGQLVLGEGTSYIEVSDNNIDGGWATGPEWSWHRWGQDNEGQAVAAAGTENSGIELEATYVHTRNNWLHNNSTDGISILDNNHDVMMEKDDISGNGFRGIFVHELANQGSALNISLFNVNIHDNNSQYTATNASGQSNDTGYFYGNPPVNIRGVLAHPTPYCYFATPSGSNFVISPEYYNPTHCLVDGNTQAPDRYWAILIKNVSGQVCLQDSSSGLRTNNRPHDFWGYGGSDDTNTSVRVWTDDPSPSSPAYQPCASVNAFAPPRVGRAYY